MLANTIITQFSVNIPWLAASRIFAHSLFPMSTLSVVVLLFFVSEIIYIIKLITNVDNLNLNFLYIFLF